MTVHDDDIGGLFKAIGGKNNQFKEFSKLSEAAQERWPLFKTVGVEKRPPPPQLLQSEKQLWQNQSAPAPLPAVKNKGSALGSKIARGLSKLAHAPSSVPVHPPIMAVTHPPAPTTAVASATEALPAARRMTQPAPHQPEPAHAATHLPPGLPTRHAPASHQATARSGLFARPPAQAAADNRAPSPLRDKGRKSLLPEAAGHSAAPLAGKLPLGKSLPGKPSAKPAKSAPGSSGLFARTDTASAAPPAKNKVRGKSRSGLFAAPDELPAAPIPVNLFGKKDEPASSGKKLFGPGKRSPLGRGSTIDSRNESRAGGGDLSSLFERLGEGAPPATSKHRGLFNRNG